MKTSLLTSVTSILQLKIQEKTMTTNNAILDPLNNLLKPEELTPEKIREIIYILKDQYTDLVKSKDEELRLKDELI